MDESKLNPFAQDSTYILNAESAVETVRLVEQAKRVSFHTGLFPKGVAITEEMKMLDIGCGPGTWALDVAFALPNATVIGIDVNETLVRHAELMAVTQSIHNVAFEVVNAFKHLASLGRNTFDLVHLRFASSWVPRESWSRMLAEIYDLLKAGGYGLFTEGEWPATTSSALREFHRLLSEAMYNAKIGPSTNTDPQGVIVHLGKLLYQAGFTQVQLESCAIDFSGHNEQDHRIWFNNVVALFHLVKPFLEQHVKTTMDLNFLHSEMVRQMWEEDFCGVGSIYTYYARKPETKIQRSYDGD